MEYNIDQLPLVIFALKKLLQVTIHTLEAVNLAHTMSPTRRSGGSLSFRPFGGVSFLANSASSLVLTAATALLHTQRCLRRHTAGQDNSG